MEQTIEQFWLELMDVPEEPDIEEGLERYRQLELLDEWYLSED